MYKLKLVAVFAAILVGVGIYLFLAAAKKPQETPHTTVVVAAVDIPENTRITEEMLTTKSISDDSLLDNYIVDPQTVVGKVMTSDVFAGEQIVTNRLVAPGEDIANKQTLAYALTPGMRAITIFVVKDTGLENFLKPGNRVDILANYSHKEEVRPDEEKVRPDEENNASEDPTSETQAAQEVNVPTTQLLAQNINILAVGSVMNKNGTTEYTSVTLEATIEDAMNIDAVAWWGGLRLLLRSPLDEEIIEIEPVTQDSIYPEEVEEEGA